MSYITNWQEIISGILTGENNHFKNNVIIYFLPALVRNVSQADRLYTNDCNSAVSQNALDISLDFPKV